MSELQAVQTVVERYFKGLHEGDLALLQSLFLKEAIIAGHYEGERILQGLTQYLGVLKRLPTPILLGEDFAMEITAIDTVGGIAHVRTSYLFEALTFTDFLSLAKADGEWKIVSKVFHHD